MFQHFTQKFQSTPLREGRHGVGYGTSRSSKGFNPRPYVRGDSWRHRRACQLGGFNPRPYVRGDRIVLSRMVVCPQFQSTPLREGRREPRTSAENNDRFNPRPYVRGDLLK